MIELDFSKDDVVSIHALMRVRHFDKVLDSMFLYVSIHALMRVRPCMVKFSTVVEKFQSTHS